MAKIFDDILVQGVRKGQIPARTQGARDWFRDKARSTRNAFAYPDNILKTSEGEKPRVGPGRMLHFYYDPKTKQQLPYYDRFPLVFHAGDAKGGFYGLNLHYLPPQLRAALMDNLYDITSNKRYDETTRLRLSYDILDKASKFRYFKPCVKRYLTSQMQSRFLYVYPSEWDIALFLPLERFQGARKTTVFKDSRQLIRNG